MRNARGFTLIEIVVVMAIMGFLVAMAAMAARAIASSQRRAVTTTRLASVDAALLQFVMVQKRLPCPADGSVASGGVNAGVEGAHDNSGCTNNQAKGVVPWTTLGITEADATDGWDRRFTYRIDPTLAASSAMDMSYCDPAGSGVVYTSPPPRCNPACGAANLTLCTTPQAFLTGKGLKVQNTGGTLVAMDPNATPATGAAYVVISHGESGGGAYLGSGQLSSSTSTDGTGEYNNYADQPLGGHYVEDSISDVAGASHFDDILSRPTILTVINKAALGPRSHL